MKTLIQKVLCGIISLSFGYACVVDTSVDSDTDRLDEAADEEVSSIHSPLQKGAVGAVNGQSDYCNGATLCGSGEGDCDTHAQCAPGLLCGRDNGAQFGFTAGSDVCVPAHCSNKRSDGDETGVDCGGSCGSICDAAACISLPNGANDKCVGGPCVCTTGQGDCDYHSDCAAGLLCGRDNGAQFGFTAGSDVCVPAHCSNKRSDGDETGVDCGGSCGSICGTAACIALPNGANDKCVGGPCVCTTGQGDCDFHSDCDTGLVCGRDNGAKFGFTAGSDVCVPPHCGNRVLDADETEIDCGGECGTLGSCGGGTPASCGNGVLNGIGLTSIVYTWLATCNGDLGITFGINGSTALVGFTGSCNCGPGIQTQTLSDAPTLALLHGGSNQLSAVSGPGIAFAWAKVTFNFADSSSSTVVLHDAGGGGNAEANEPDLCAADYQYDVSATQTLNGVPGEECDDGNVVAGDGCNADCTL